MGIPKGLENPNINAIPYDCPHCGVLSQHSKNVVPGFQDQKNTQSQSGGGIIYYSQEQHVILTCLNCQRVTYLLFQPPFLNSPTTVYPGSTFDILHVHPVATPTRHQ